MFSDLNDYFKRRSELEKDRVIAQQQADLKDRYRVTHNPLFDDWRMSNIDREIARLDQMMSDLDSLDF